MQRRITIEMPRVARKITGRTKRETRMLRQILMSRKIM